MDWIQQWQSKLNKQNGVAPLVRTGGSRHTGLAALPYRNIQADHIFCFSCVCFPIFPLKARVDYNRMRMHALRAFYCHE